MELTSVRKHPSFLSGGGACGALIRNFNWEATPLGDPVQWPGALRHAVQFMLHATLPVYIAWGPKLIRLYNDSYIPFLGPARHPRVLGTSSMDEPEIWSAAEPLLFKQVLQGESVFRRDFRVSITKNNIAEDCYFDLTYTPLYNDDDTVGGFQAVFIETTDKVRAINQTVQGMQRFRSLVQQAPAAISVCRGPQFIIEVANDAYLPLLGMERTDVVGKPAFDLLPQARQVLEPILQSVMQTGERYELKEYAITLHRNGREELCYFNAVYEPLREADGTISGVMTVAHEITDQIKARKKVEESEERFRRLFESSIIGVLFWDLAGGVLNANDTFLNMLGYTKDDVAAGLDWRSMTPPQWDAADLKGLEEVRTTGHHHPFEKQYFHKNGHTVDVLLGSVAFPETNFQQGVSFVIDISERKRTEERLRESEAHFKQLIDTVPATIWMTDPSGYCTYLNPRWYQFTGQTQTEAFGYGWLDVVHPDDRDESGKVFLEANEQKIPFSLQYRLRNSEGAYCWAIDTARPRFAPDGTYEGMIGTVVDIHNQKLAEEKIKESEELFRSLIAAAPAAITLFAGPDLIITEPNQEFINLLGRGPEIAGKPLAVAMPELSTADQPFLQLLHRVYTTGVAHHDFGALAKIERNSVLRDEYHDFSYTPLKDEAGKVYAILQISTNVTEQTRAKQRLEETEKRARLSIEAAELGTVEYDFATDVSSFSEKALAIVGLSHTGTVDDYIAAIHPDDLQVRQAAHKRLLESGMLAYEVRVLWPDASVHWIKVRGDVINDAQGKPGKIVGVLQDITAEKLREESLEAQVNTRTRELAAANEKLEQAVEELRRSNEELSQYAYVASHDLQEPLRKIRIFSGMLSTSKELPENLTGIVEKIDRSAGRMSGLIKDLLDFSQLSKTESLMRPLALNEVVQAVLGDFELLIQEKEARIEVGALPIVEGVALQMNQLFYNLIGNALKFNTAKQPPVVRLYSTPITGGEAARRVAALIPDTLYHHIIVEDNGIGFDPLYVEKIFEIFKRLHTRDMYAGSGIGLALCRRIVVNHKGAIWAEARQGGGANFHIILPEQQMLFQPEAPAGLAWK